jgi:hypothetical protein
MKIIPLPAAKATSTDVFRDWTLVPGNPRMLSGSLQGDTIAWICRSPGSAEQPGMETRKDGHYQSTSSTNTPLHQNHRVTLTGQFCERKKCRTFANKPLEQISKLWVHVVRYLHWIIDNLLNGKGKSELYAIGRKKKRKE